MSLPDFMLGFAACYGLGIGICRVAFMRANLLDSLVDGAWWDWPAAQLMLLLTCSAWPFHLYISAKDCADELRAEFTGL